MRIITLKKTDKKLIIQVFYYRRPSIIKMYEFDRGKYCHLFIYKYIGYKSINH